MTDNKNFSVRDRYITILWNFIALFFLCAVISSNTLLAQMRDKTISASLQIQIEGSGNIGGHIDIKSETPISSSIPIYILLPFQVRDVKSDEGLYTSYEVVYEGISNGYTILNIIVSSKVNQTNKVSFRIVPSIRRSSEFAFSSLNKNSNFLIIEDRGSARNTLYFRFAVQPASQSFGSISDLTDSMLVPEQISISFPPDTIFDATPPTFLSSNVSEGNFPGIQQETLFVTNINFYVDNHLRINYVLSRSTTRPGIIIYAGVLLLITFVPGVLAFPEEMIRKKTRLGLALICIILSPILFTVNLWYEGTEYLRENIVFFIGGVIAYVFVTFVLILQTAPYLRAAWNNFRSRSRPTTPP